MRIKTEFEFVDEVIQAFQRDFPEAWISFCNGMDHKRANLKNQRFGEWHKGLGEGRSVASFPNDNKGNNLLTVIEKFVPDLLTTPGKIDRFLRAYPMFRIPDKL